MWIKNKLPGKITIAMLERVYPEKNGIPTDLILTIFASKLNQIWQN